MMVIMNYNTLVDQIFQIFLLFHAPFYNSSTLYLYALQFYLRPKKK
jgi:hypothetical protein